MKCYISFLDCKKNHYAGSGSERVYHEIKNEKNLLENYLHRETMILKIIKIDNSVFIVPLLI